MDAINSSCVKERSNCIAAVTTVESNSKGDFNPNIGYVRVIPLPHRISSEVPSLDIVKKGVLKVSIGTSFIEGIIYVSSRCKDFKCEVTASSLVIASRIDRDSSEFFPMGRTRRNAKEPVSVVVK
jgi:hypothetical protein